MYPLDRYIGKYMPENPTIIEAGSHAAGDTLYMHQLWPKGQIYTFEPNPYWHPMIREKIAPYSNIHFYPLALGDSVGSTNFFEFLSDKGGGDCTLPPLLNDHFWTVDIKNTNFAPPIKVPMMTLDAWAEEHGIQKVDFMWLDMEGSEGKALAGAEKLLKNTRIIQTEWTERSVYEGSIGFQELHQFLTDRGFVCSCICKNQPQEIRGDALFFKVMPT